MAIASLSTINLNKYRGGAVLAQSGGLATDFVAAVTKLNEVITGIGTSDTLTVGTGTGAYYSSGSSWLNIDGTNPPTLDKLRFIDQVTGAYRTLTINSGVATVS